MNTPEPQPASDASKFPTFARVGPSVGRWLLRLAVLLFGLAVLYFLSIGPALQLNKRGHISPETIERVYFPLSLVSGVPGFNWLFESYLRLWMGPEPELR